MFNNYLKAFSILLPCFYLLQGTKELEAKLEECKNAMTATFQITS